MEQDPNDNTTHHPTQETKPTATTVETTTPNSNTTSTNNNYNNNSNKSSDSRKCDGEGEVTDNNNRVRYSGVRKRKGRWVAEIRVPPKRSRKWLGAFDTAVEAARAHDRAAIIHYGPKAHLNYKEPSGSIDNANSSDSTRGSSPPAPPPPPSSLQVPAP